MQKAVDKLDEDTITRKSHTIVDELTNNKDFKVCCILVLTEVCMNQICHESSLCANGQVEHKWVILFRFCVINQHCKLNAVKEPISMLHCLIFPSRGLSHHID